MTRQESGGANFRAPGRRRRGVITAGRDLAGRLIAAQFPRWAGLGITATGRAGTDNVVYRLGGDLAVRLPRHGAAAASVAAEWRWLPRLAPLLPLAVPVPVALGVPGEGFPYPWLVCRWVPGESAAPLGATGESAVLLGQFVAALQRIDAGGGPRSFRGGPVGVLDARVRAEIGVLSADGTVDAGLVTGAWDAARGVPAWDRAPVWVHADLYPVNLIALGGRLTGVIDFGGLGAGDPAIDMLPAWAWLEAGTRDLFRAEVQADDATWARGRAWALGLGIGAVHYYRTTSPSLAAIGHHAITQVLSDQVF